MITFSPTMTGTVGGGRYCCGDGRMISSFFVVTKTTDSFPETGNRK